MSRARKMLEFLAATPGANLRQVTEAAGMDPDSGRDRNLVAVQLSQLQVVGKVTRSGKRGSMRYHSVSGSLAVDGKRKKPAPAPKATDKPARYRAPADAVAQRKAPTPPPAPPAAPLRDRPLPPKPAADHHSRESMIRCFQSPPKRGSELTSDQIAADVAEFLRRGGRIQQLANGAASKPLRSLNAEASYVAVNERSWRDRQRRLAEEAITDEDDDDDLAAA